jgi:hypothetical protein
MFVLYVAVSSGAKNASEVRKLLSWDRLQELLPSSLSSLMCPWQPVRCAMLRLLCAFDRPLCMGGQPSHPTNAPPGAEVVDVLSDWHKVESMNFSLREGRMVTATVSRMRNHLEYERVDPALRPAMVAAAVGALHIRYSMLWPPCADALSAGLEFCADVAWPLMLEAMAEAQGAMLSGQGRGSTATPVKYRHSKHANAVQEDDELEEEEGAGCRDCDSK